MGLQERIRTDYQEAKMRDERWLMKFDFEMVRKALILLLSVYILLEVMDVITTLTALSNSSIFTELNPIAHGLFQLQLLGFVLAIAVKFLPLVILSYCAFMPESGKNQVHIRTVKLGVLVSLGAANALLIAIVMNNLSVLMAGLG